MNPPRIRNVARYVSYFKVFGSWKTTKTRNAAPYVSHFNGVFGSWKTIKIRNVDPTFHILGAFGPWNTIKTRNVAPYISHFKGFWKPFRAELNKKWPRVVGYLHFLARKQIVFGIIQPT